MIITEKVAENLLMSEDFNNLWHRQISRISFNTDKISYIDNPTSIKDIYFFSSTKSMTNNTVDDLIIGCGVSMLGYGANGMQEEESLHPEIDVEKLTNACIAFLTIVAWTGALSDFFKKHNLTFTEDNLKICAPYIASILNITFNGKVCQVALNLIGNYNITKAVIFSPESGTEFIKTATEASAGDLLTKLNFTAQVVGDRTNRIKKSITLNKVNVKFIDNLLKETRLA